MKKWVDSHQTTTCSKNPKNNLLWTNRTNRKNISINFIPSKNPEHTKNYNEYCGNDVI